MAHECLWLIRAKIDLFREINIDKHRKCSVLSARTRLTFGAEGFPKLATFSIVLGAMYAAVAAIGFFGAAAAGLVRSTLAPSSSRQVSWSVQHL